MQSCCGIVLAGGLSSRMGANKAQLQRNACNENTQTAKAFHKQDMLSFSKQLLTDVGVDQVLVSGNNYDIPDQHQQAGPMGGIFSAISATSCQSLLILPVDLPLMTTKTLKQLKITGELSHQAVHYQTHSLPLYLPINGYTELFFSKAFAQFSGKGPSIRAMFQQIPHQVLPLTDQQAFINTNTPQQWQHAQQLLNNRSRKYYG